jgi:lipopolysaccharide/colanic/teichoic acid biosynthesis glycosyltransferase
MPEPLFLRALSLERKRAERSHKLFVLMLVEVGNLAEPVERGPLLARTVPAILCTIREIDVAGWHKEYSTFGVIFAELGAAEKKSVLAALGLKVTTALQMVLRPDELPHINITFHCFPDDWGNGDDAEPPIANLYPDLRERDDARKIARVVKRGMDFLGSALALLLLSPLLLTIALAIKLTSPGPVLFRQKRIGQYGAPFTCLKFRSMHAVNDPQIHMEYVKRFVAGKVQPQTSGSNGKTIYKLTDDPRLTPIGRLLRKTSLDELPQFFNVLRGEMSLVGPRPAVPYEFEAYDVWHRRRLLEVRPGLTGLWQVNGRSRLPFDEMVRLDLRYATTWSLWLDLKILLRTPRAVLSGEGAY